MKNTLYIVALNRIGFDFSSLPEDLQITSSWVLSSSKEYNAQVERLDDVTWRSMRALYPDNEIIQSVESVKPLSNSDLTDNFNTMAYDPNELLPGSEPVNGKGLSKECFDILTEKNEDLNRYGVFVRTAYLDAVQEPQVMTVIYYTHDKFVDNKLSDIFAFLEQTFKDKFDIKYPNILSNKIRKLFMTEPERWNNSISEIVNTNILLFNDLEVVCTHKEPLKD
jgi:hypothetical protein